MMDEHTQRWQQRYRESLPEQMPWHREQPAESLVEAVRRGLLPKGVTVDLGCGTGTDLMYLAQQGYRVIGVDIAIEPLRFARQRFRQAGLDIPLIQADARFLPFRDASIQLICDSGCFHSFAPEIRPMYARSVARVLKPGGILFMREFHADQPQPPEGGPYRLKLEEFFEVFTSYFRFLSVGEVYYHDLPPDRRRLHIVRLQRR
ncbi:MAG: class I SAM-dependent methyltransferase [Armatimonadota bacterium]